MDELISRDELIKRRGWSPKNIRTLKIKHVKEENYEKYYSLAEVMEIEKTDLFREVYEPPLVVQKTILDRPGWTKKVMEKFNLIPAREVKNPHFSCAAPMKLYNLEQIEEIEKSAEFKEIFEKIEKRKEIAKKSAAKGVATKKKKTLDDVATFNVKVKRVKNVTNLAIASYNNFQMERGRFEMATACLASDDSFLDRITVNYIRHNCTSYDNHLDRIRGRTGVHEGYDFERFRIFQEIAKVYPEYKDECEKQYGGSLDNE